MKLTASVRRVAVRGINRRYVGRSPAGEDMFEDMPDAVRVELDVDRDGTCMYYRYGVDDVFCGDSWFETLEAAKHHAAYEYGIGEHDWAEAATE